jgi:UDP-N-acetylglucosamine diphosphorylase / glucose-1-phosphate thymidylyltransferase / UDP-N-acetylgalactosamine diphosphorylase / glucosamine-1-phosphate N-acetyltransferase / galactosamine-1-phosphate N-acetyltransferase
MTRTAAILARGLGTRMRRTDATAALDDTQAAVATSGVKGMIPIPAGPDAAARPFLDYVLSELADVGITDVVLVVGPEHDAIRDYFGTHAPPKRVRVRFATQVEPIGTADAVVVAAEAIGDEPFLVLNADNFYPAEALRLLVNATDAATVAFDREALVRDGNIERERVRAFAVLAVDATGRLVQIIEKPGDQVDLASDAARWVGMNCWRVTPALVSACRRVARSARGEFELPEAVALALREGTTVQTYPVALPVLDLSQRADIPAVTARLATVVPSP